MEDQTDSVVIALLHMLLRLSECRFGAADQDKAFCTGSSESYSGLTANTASL